MKQHRTGLTLATVVASFALVLSACGDGGGGDTNDSDTGNGSDGEASEDVGGEAAGLDGTLTIGAVLPLTGSSATVGMDQQRGIELAVEEINANGGVLGKALVVRIEDSEGRAESAIQAAQKLVNVDDVPVIIGEYSSGNTIPMQQFLQEQGVVGLNPGSSSSLVRDNGDLQFSTIGLDNVAGEFSAQSLRDAGYESISIIAPNNAYGSGAAENVTNYFEELGGAVNTSVLYTEGQTDYRQDLERLRSSDPDAYVVTMYGQDGTVVNRQMFELGLSEKPVFHIYLSMDIPDADPASVEGQWGMDVGITGDAGEAYAQAYEDSFGEPFVTAFNGFSYDATIMAAEAINAAGSADSADIAEALPGVSQDYNGVTGEIRFDADGQRTSQEYLIADVRDGQIVPR